MKWSIVILLYPHKYIQHHHLERFEQGINLDERGAGPDPKLHG